MDVTFDRKFVKDISILPEYIHVSFAKVYEICKKASNIGEIPHCRKIEGNEKLYRIRVGDFRATFLLKDANTIVFRRFLSRGQVYKKHVK